MIIVVVLDERIERVATIHSGLGIWNGFDNWQLELHLGLLSGQPLECFIAQQKFDRRGC